jgi:hypothetical protein
MDNFDDPVLVEDGNTVSAYLLLLKSFSIPRQIDWPLQYEFGAINTWMFGRAKYQAPLLYPIQHVAKRSGVLTNLPVKILLVNWESASLSAAAIAVLRPWLKEMPYLCPDLQHYEFSMIPELFRGRCYRNLLYSDLAQVACEKYDQMKAN